MVLSTDVLIFGGGCAGLWLLDDLRRRGLRVLLLESGPLGGTQTTGSQGILHGGTKYVLQGIFSASAGSVRDMPGRWRASLQGTIEPDLSQVRSRGRHCYLWRSDSLLSRLGMFGAQNFLTVKPVPLNDVDRPPLLARCPGQVFRLDEEVIDTVSFAQVMAERNQDAILQINADHVAFDMGSDEKVTSVTIRNPNGSEELRIGAGITAVADAASVGADAASIRHVATFIPASALTIRVDQIVLAAGAGNERMREQIGLPLNAMQRRPLHMVLARGELPLFNGHCVDGAKTRVTITADRDSAGRGVWQIGGQLAEDGVRLQPEALIRHARQELLAVLPGWNPNGIEWATYRIDRAEARTAGGSRPDDVQLIHEHNVLTIWPTKLVLAPRMTERVVEHLGALNPRGLAEFHTSLNQLNWPAPTVALPPWELQSTWISGV